MLSRDIGQRRVPAPPHMITGVNEEDINGANVKTYTRESGPYRPHAYSAMVSPATDAAFIPQPAPLWTASLRKSFTERIDLKGRPRIVPTVHLSSVAFSTNLGRPASGKLPSRVEPRIPPHERPAKENLPERR